MNRACFYNSTSLHEQNKHTSFTALEGKAITPLTINSALTQIKYLTLLFITFILFSAISCKKNDGPDDQTKNTNIVNEWIYEGMNTVYLWNQQIPPGINPLTETDPLELFEKMTYRNEDQWSWITDDYLSFFAELQGVPMSMGYAPVFGLIGPNQIAIIVKNVYPNSPASEAGLKRGDIIVKIDGVLLDRLNYYQLYSKESYTVELGMVVSSETRQVLPSGVTYKLTQKIIEANPIPYHGILNINGKKTGYLVYNDFTSGIDDKFANQLGGIFDDFSADGISEMIVDLRYNPGGEINAAAFLASCLAPAATVNPKSVLVKFVYNNDLQQYYKDQGGVDSKELVLKFTPRTPGLNLSRVFFLVSSGTASASELVIIGLKPYMNVVMVGDTTHGKYTGAWVINDTKRPPRHNYAMVPIVLKYSNAVGFTDFKNGLEPDFLASDDFLNLKAYGDLEDPVLSKAVELLGGDPGKKSAISPQKIKIIKSKNELMKMNLIVPHGEIPFEISETSDIIR